jgi:lysophospholipase L1-like esterase
MLARAPDDPDRVRRVLPLAAHWLLAFSSCALLSLAIVSVEWLARWLAPDYLVRTRGIHVSSTSYGWSGRPHAVAAMGGGRVSLNRHGYRGREFVVPKPGDRTRVVVLGDSIAFGFGVSDEQSFPALLDARDNGMEAGNFAVQGYGPGQELLVLQRDGLRVDPDVVVLALCLRNDLADAVLPVALYNGVTPRPHFRLVGEQLVLEDTLPRSAAARVVGWLRDYSQLYNRASALLTAPPKPAEASWRQRKQEALRDEDYVLRLTVALIKEMDELCRERGIAFLAASFPNGVDFSGEPPLQRRLHELLSRAGIRVFDFRAYFKGLGMTPADVTLDDTGHLSPRGHAIVAEVLERRIALGSQRTGQAAIFSPAPPTAPGDE